MVVSSRRKIATSLEFDRELIPLTILVISPVILGVSASFSLVFPVAPVFFMSTLPKGIIVLLDEAYREYVPDAL